MIKIRLICECGNEDWDNSALPVSRRLDVIIVTKAMIYICKKCGKLMKMQVMNVTETAKVTIVGEI